MPLLSNVFTPSKIATFLSTHNANLHRRLLDGDNYITVARYAVACMLFDSNREPSYFNLTTLADTTGIADTVCEWEFSLIQKGVINA